MESYYICEVWVFCVEYGGVYGGMDIVVVDEYIDVIGVVIGEVQVNVIVFFVDCFSMFGKVYLFQWEYFGQCCQQIGMMDGQLWCVIFLFGGVVYG